MGTLFGSKRNQVSTNADLGDLAFVNADGIDNINVSNLTSKNLYRDFISAPRKPELVLDFTKTKLLDSYLNFTRSSTATYVDSDGLIKTAAAETPRFDYDPTTGACKGLLLEEESTNLFTYSEAFDNAAWVKGYCTIAANSGVAPDGTTTADKLVETVDNQQHYVNQTKAIPSGTTYTFSVFAKASGRNWLLLWNQYPASKAWFDLSNGVVGTTTGVVGTEITYYGNGWYRCSMTCTSNNSAIGYHEIHTATADNVTTFAGNTSNGILMWGAQIEEIGYVTSYIPTALSTVTRLVDNLSITDVNWLDSDEGTFLLELSGAPRKKTSNSFVIKVATADSSAYLAMGYIASSGLYFGASYYRSSGAAENTIYTEPDIGQGSRTTVYKTASSYKRGVYYTSAFNGRTMVETTNVPIPPDFTNIDFTSHGGRMSVTIKGIRYYNKAIPKLELQEMTK